jgi:hypothetical protein
VSLDVIKVGGRLESVILPIQPTHPAMDVRIAATYSSNIALEMADIDGIESYNRHEESDISFSQAITDEVSLVLQQSLGAVECFKEVYDGGLICLGSLRKTTLVYAIVDLIIDPLVYPINLLAMLRRIKVKLRFIFRDDRIELRVKHADNLGRLVIDNRMLFLIPDYRDRESARIVRVCAEVEVLDMLGLVKRVDISSRERVHRRERPSVRAHSRRDDSERYDIFEAFQLAHDKSAGSPRTRIRHIKVITIFLGWELTPGLDEVPEGGRGTLERPLCISGDFGYVGEVGDVAGRHCPLA